MVSEWLSHVKSKRGRAVLFLNHCVDNRHMLPFNSDTGLGDVKAASKKLAGENMKRKAYIRAGE